MCVSTFISEDLEGLLRRRVFGHVDAVRQRCRTRLQDEAAIADLRTGKHVLQ